VPLFRRKRDLNERSPRQGVRFKDLAVLDQLVENGADLSASRHVICYSYAPRQDTAEAMRQEAELNGYAASVRETLPEFPGQGR
jgi:Regulator of ribonuclease activity B